MKNKPLVSVVIPVYDRTVQLRAAVNSILEQTLQDFEVLIICDGSPPETISVLRSMEDSRLRIFYLPRQSGSAVRGRNKGILEAKADYVAFLDSDDLALPQRLVKSLECIGQADAIYSAWLPSGSKQPTYCPEMDFDLLQKVCIPCISTFMAKRSSLIAIGGFKPQMRFFEDWELWLRMLASGLKFKVVPDVLAIYSEHNCNLSLQFKTSRDYWFAKMLTEYQIIPRCVDDAPEDDLCHNHLP